MSEVFRCNGSEGVKGRNGELHVREGTLGKEKENLEEWENPGEGAYRCHRRGNIQDQETFVVNTAKRTSVG